MGSDNRTRLLLADTEGRLELQSIDRSGDLLQRRTLRTLRRLGPESRRGWPGRFDASALDQRGRVGGACGWSDRKAIKPPTASARSADGRPWTWPRRFPGRLIFSGRTPTAKSHSGSSATRVTFPLGPVSRPLSWLDRGRHPASRIQVGLTRVPWGCSSLAALFGAGVA